MWRIVMHHEYAVSEEDQDDTPRYTTEYALLLLSLLEDVAAQRTRLTVQPVVTRTMMGSRPPANMGAVVVYDALKRALWRKNRPAIDRWAEIAERLVEGRIDPQLRHLGTCANSKCDGEMGIDDAVPGIAICPDCGHIEKTTAARRRALEGRPNRLVTLEEAAVVLHAIGIELTADQLRWRARNGYLIAAEVKGKARRRYWLSDITNPDDSEVAA
jgi:hypothetical protein